VSRRPSGTQSQRVNRRPTGKSTAYRHAQRLETPSPARKTRIPGAFQSDLVVQSCAKKYSAFHCPQINGFILPSHLIEEGVRVSLLCPAMHAVHAHQAQIARRANLSQVSVLAPSGKSERCSRASRLDEEGRTRGRHDT
jgi:hypothetical protein